MWFNIASQRCKRLIQNYLKCIMAAAGTRVGRSIYYINGQLLFPWGPSWFLVAKEEKGVSIWKQIFILAQVIILLHMQENDNIRLLGQR